MRRTVIQRELERSELYSEALGISLRDRTDEVCFRWFLASVLYGGHISEKIAANTYQAFVRHGLTAPKDILASGWDFLVNPIMREGGYVRYDGRKSDQILNDCEHLQSEHGGSLKHLQALCGSTADLESRIAGFYGVGPVTTNIFLRELRPYWRHADPDPLPVVSRQAALYGIDLSSYARKTMLFARVEAGLIRASHTRPKRSKSKTRTA